MRCTQRITLVLALASAGAGTARGQAITNPNQITGLVELAATNPEILDVLRQGSGLGQGLVDARFLDEIRARSVGLSPELGAATSIQVFRPALRRGDYDLTVESSDAGIAYELTAEVYLDGEKDVYRFAQRTSDPVLSDPAPDVVLDFSECPGMLRVSWTDAAGNPFLVAGGSIRAFRESAPGSGVFADVQASVRDVGEGPSTEYLAVRGDARFRVEIRYLVRFGSDPFSDLLTVERRCDFEVDVACDEVVPLTCVCDGSGAGGGDLGRIVGEVDVVGEDEHVYDLGPISSRTLVGAYDGPYGNWRVDRLGQFPSQGPYELENLLPAPEGYRVEAAVAFGRGDDFEVLALPALGSGANPRVPVGSGETVDLGSTFVLDPGYIRGKVALAGPRPGPFGSYFSSLIRELHEDDDGLPVTPSPSASGVSTTGLGDVAPGATYSAAGGAAKTGFGGDVDVSGRNLDGFYRLVVGGLDGEPSTWRSGSLGLLFSDGGVPGEPGSYRDLQLGITERAIGTVLVEPGTAATVNHRYCFSEVNLGFISTSGTFYEPRLGASGDFVGPPGGDRDYAVSGIARGTPLDVRDATGRGLVAMALPEGEYVVSPAVTSLSPRGRESATELPELRFPVGCRQRMNLVAGLVPQMAELPECTPDPRGLISGGVSSEVEVTRLYYTLNGGPEIDLCAPCGVSPTYAFGVDWLPCENEVTVVALDARDRTASITAFTSLDPEPPRAETARFKVWPPDHRHVCFTDVARALRVTDNCPGPLKTELVGCKSDQPDDQQGADGAGFDGDGSTTHDCVLSDDRTGLCVRAERLAQCPAGRTYSAQFRVTDACGLTADLAVELHVPHDEESGKGLPPAEPEAHLGPHGEPPFAWTPVDDPDAGLPEPFTCDGARAPRTRSLRAADPGGPARRGVSSRLGPSWGR
jgi:hypothetical protein